MQVEVIHNAFKDGPLPNLENTIHRFTAAPQSIRDEVHKYLHSLPRTSTEETVVVPRSVESATREASRPASISSKTSKLSKKGKGKGIATPAEVSDSQATSVVADDENDEWEDESEASEPDTEPHTLLPKKKYHAATKGRRRESFRRSALARHAVAVAVQSPSPSDSGDAAGSEAGVLPPPTPLRKLSLGQRSTHIRGVSDSILIPPGDPSGLPRPTLHSHGSGSALRSRFDRLKNGEFSGPSSPVRTRESSPARVIRFAKQSPPERTPAQTAPPSDDEYTPPSPAPGNAQSRFA